MRYCNLILLGLLLLWFTGCKDERTERPLPGQIVVSNSNVPTRSSDYNRQVVFLCDNAAAARYHYNENCVELMRCKPTIERITIKKADAIGITLCKLE